MMTRMRKKPVDVYSPFAVGGTTLAAASEALAPEPCLPTPGEAQLNTTQVVGAMVD